MPTKANKPATPRKPRNVNTTPDAAPVTPAAAPDKPLRDASAERAFARETFAAMHTRHGGSIAVKPVADFKPVAITAKHAPGATVTERAAASVAIAFARNGVALADGASTSRFFDADGAAYCIENGALKRAVTGGLITVSGDRSARITLRPGAVAAMRAVLGKRLA